MSKKHSSIENTPTRAGGNLAPNEVSIGAEARKLIQTYELQTSRLEKLTSNIHETILQFGRLLQTGRDMYQSPKEFGGWIERRGLNTGRLASHQVERSACMNIARLYDVGVDVYADDTDSATRAKLDLSNCRMTTPSNILKWARKTQPSLFPHIPRKHTPVAVTTDNASKHELARGLAESNKRLSETQSKFEEAEAFIMSELQIMTPDKLGRTESEEVEALKAENKKLWLENAELRSKLKPLDLSNADEVIKAILANAGASTAKTIANGLLASVKRLNAEQAKRLKGPEDVPF
jgi:uncharacterized protein (DUF2384 family)